MTDIPAPSASAAPAGPLRALEVRLPVLRRPPGWGVLDEPALRVRATQLYLAWMQQGGEGAGGGLGSLAWTCGPVSPEVSPKVPPEDAGLDPARTEPFAEPADEHPAVDRAVHPAETRPRTDSHWHLLPWVLLLGGAMIMTPWLIWAPLVGGLCMGLLLLQTGMLRHWLQTRNLQEEVAAGASDRRASSLAQPHGQFEEAGIEAVQSVGPRRLRFAHGGWMLSAALVLVGAQAAMLITTLQLKSREPAALAGAIRAAQTGRDTRQGTPPDPQQARERPGEESAALTVPPPPEARSAGAAGPRPGGAP